VDALDLNIVKRVDRNIVASGLLDLLCKTNLVVTLDLDERLLEVRISGVGNKLLEILE
jgi:hypothetical protein